MSKNKDISSAASSALFGAARFRSFKKQNYSKKKVEIRRRAHRRKRVRSQSFSGDSDAPLYSLIFVSCALVALLLYATS
ncbi:MAG: hypothetical protein QGH25_00175 [Candidatus Latescibacteria bacterium]|nr:hypothetical protein [Candidatus Latescibacterota bacterium]